MFDLGLKLRELRKKKKWTQKRLGELLDISEASISKYESNIASPSIDILRAYAVLFNISMDELLGNDIEKRVSLKGLNDEQEEIIKKLVDVFRESKETNDKESYYTIGKIAVEIAKAI